jgi:hypothetical protein
MSLVLLALYLCLDPLTLIENVVEKRREKDEMEEE